MSNPSDLAVVVPNPRAEAAIERLRAEGVYDASRSVRPHDEDSVALPVTAAPADTEVQAVVETDLPLRERGLDDLLAERGWSDAELARTPSSWAVLGTVVLVEMGDVPRPAEVGEALLALHGGADTVLARGRVSGREREPAVEVVAGAGDTETVHVEHGTRYAMDLAEVMFSPGNKAERARMGETVAAGERVFDMFAGIGYFALPMARAGARVTAAEINPVAYRYLVENAVLNGVEDRIDAYRGDCRDVARGIANETSDGAGAGVASGAESAGSAETDADRVVMGHYDAHEYLGAALDVLEPGGVVHVHEATPEVLVPDRPVERLEAAADERGRTVDVLDWRDVKGYSEGVRHVVVDARVE